MRGGGRLLLVLAGTALLSGCGFTPLYGEAGISGGLSRIAVTTPDEPAEVVDA